MLKNIPPILSPELLKVLCEMGHGDEIILADGNFPAESIGKDAIVVRADGHGTVELLEAILQFLPLDQYVEKPVALMKVVDGDPCKPTIWDSYKQKLNESGNDPAKIEMVERFAFYERAHHAYTNRIDKVDTAVDDSDLIAGCNIQSTHLLYNSVAL